MTAKEIWYVWDGDITSDMSFIEDVTKVRFSDGSFVIVDKESSYRSKPIMWYLWGKWCNSGVRAYTLGEKRERVECEACVSSRFKGLIYCGGYFEFRKCPDCQGLGYIWKLGEKK